MFLLLTKVNEPADEDVDEFLPSPPPPVPVASPPATDLLVLTTGDEWSLEVLSVVLASGIRCGRCLAKLADEDVRPSTTREQQRRELVRKAAAEVPPTEEQQTRKPTRELSTKEYWKPPERLIFRACLPPAAFHMLLNDAEADVDLPKLDLDVHADPNHRWDIATTIVKEALASWKGKAVKAAMDEETRSLIGMGTWSWSNARALDMKSAFLESKLVRVLYMYQPDYYDDKTSRKRQVHDELYFKVSDDRVTCSVLVDVDDLLAPSSSTAMPKELKELLEAAFELCEILPVEKYLGLEIMCDTPSRKVWLHQQSYANKLRRRFINEEQTGRIPKTPVFVDACANLTFDIEDAQAREEEEYRKNFGLDDEAGNGLHPQQAGEQSHLEDVRD
ncbi:unnamed protein product [Closterium sp. NIES-53]